MLIFIFILPRNKRNNHNTCNICRFYYSNKCDIFLYIFCIRYKLLTKQFFPFTELKKIEATRYLFQLIIQRREPILSWLRHVSVVRHGNRLHLFALTCDWLEMLPFCVPVSVTEQT